MSASPSCWHAYSLTTAGIGRRNECVWCREISGGVPETQRQRHEAAADATRAAADATRAAADATRAAADIAATTGISMEEACAAMERFSCCLAAPTPGLALDGEPESDPVTERHSREVDL